MIYDHISNIATYKGLSPNIALGLDFLKQMKSDTAVGTYQINHRVKAIVSEYETKLENEYGYEAHRKNIDIQYLLSGEERIACLPIERLKETQPYDEESDAAFYAADIKLQPSYLSLLPGYFAIFFPQDGHLPQLCIDKPMKVKKVVVKIEV
jgi:YhcH/YjgK/YiaL family protein